jgi:hypothetical protein
MEVTRPQGPCSQLVAKDSTDPVQGVLHTSDKALWNGTETALVLPTTELLICTLGLHAGPEGPRRHVCRTCVVYGWDGARRARRAIHYVAMLRWRTAVRHGEERLTALRHGMFATHGLIARAWYRMSARILVKNSRISHGTTFL